MNRTPNTPEKTTNAQPVFNYAQAAKRSSQNLENTQKPKPIVNESKPAETKVETANVEAPSFAAALSKNTPKTTVNPSKSDKNSSAPSNREPAVELAEAKTEEIATKEAASTTVTDASVQPRRDSTHSNTSGSEPHYQHNRQYNARHNNSQGKQQSNYVPHHNKKMSPHMGSASPNMGNNQGNWQNNNQYYRPSPYYPPNQYSMPIPAYTGQSFVPQPAVSKAIPIINPNTSEVINLSAQSPSALTAKESSTTSSPAIASAAPKTEEAPKEKEFKAVPSRAIKIVNPREKEEEAERKAKEEAEQKAKEEAEQKAKEEAEQKAKEEAEKKAKEEAEQKIKEEAEKKAKEEAEKKAKEEAEQKAKEEAEKKAKEEAERKAAEEAKKVEEAKKAEEAKKVEEAKKAAEAKKAEEDTKKAEEAKKVEDAKKAEDKKVEDKKVEDKKAEDKKAQEEKTAEDAKKTAEAPLVETPAEEERIAAITAEKVARGAAPGRLDMSAIPPHVFHDSPVSTPTGSPAPKVKGPPMKVIEDFSTIDYPPEFLAPKARDPATGKITYDSAFLMQFQQLCRETDEDLSAFQSIGDDSQGGDNKRGMSRRQTSERGGRGPRTPGGSNDGMFRNNSRDGRGEMGKFSGGRQISHRQGSNGPNSPGMERQGSHGGRNRSGRGGGKGRPPREQIGAPTIPLDQVVPLEKSDNRWVPQVGDTAPAADAEKSEDALISQEIIVRKIKSLLNKLTLEKFDSISNQIWEYARQSEKEDNGQSLRTVIQLIFDKACDEPNFGSMWAQLCKKLYELMQVDNNIKDVNIVDKKTGEAVSGGPLYRKYLLNRCQQEFEKGWKSDLPKIDESAPGEIMMTDEYYAAVKAKRQGLGLVQFIGELFKRQMLTDRVMTECLIKLCSNHTHPEDEETETMCKLLTTMGKTFDTSGRKNKEWLDTYFDRMNDMYKSDTLSSRVKFMILDVFDLRKSKWTLKRGNQPAPATIAQIHEQAKKANEEKETMKRTGSSRGNSSHPVSRQNSRGGRDIQRQPSQHSQNSNQGNQNSNQGGNAPAASSDGWNTVGTGSPTTTPRSGRTNELANFGKAERSKSRSGVLGPSSSPFTSLSRTSSKPSSEKKGSTPTETRSASPATSMSNMFSALGGEGQEEEHSGERKKLQLLPRGATTSEETEEVEKTEEKPKLSDEVVERRSKSTIEEYFSLRDKKELCECVKELDHTDYRVIFAYKLLDVVEKKTDDVQVVCDMITELYKENLLSKDEVVLAFKKFWDCYEDLVIDVPQAPKHVDMLLSAAGIERSEVESESQDE